MIEKLLSVDDVFVWSMLFKTLAIPIKYQHRVPFWGIFGALALGRSSSCWAARSSHGSGGCCWSSASFGNVVGSNIANILLILGLTATLGGLAASQRIVRLDVPLLIGVSFAALVLSLDNRVGRIVGVLLLAGGIAYTNCLVRAARNTGERPEIEQEYDAAVEQLEATVVERPLAVQIGLIVVGLAALVVGSRLLVGGATDIATEFGVSDLVIGLTVVAVGTSLPELATSVMATLRGERDIAVGNVVGSNLFNLLSSCSGPAVPCPPRESP